MKINISSLMRNFTSLKLAQMIIILTKEPNITMQNEEDHTQFGR